MVVSDTSDIHQKAVLEIASRKLLDLSKMKLQYKRFAELMGSRLRSNSKVSDKFKLKVSFGINSYCSPSCGSRGIIDILVRRNDLFSFKEACDLLGHCDVDENLTLIEEMIRKYGIVIIGLPECSEEDLLLAVYFFIEDMFGIKPRIELCKRIVEEGETNMVGVIFDSIMIKKKIVEKHHILEGSDIVIDSYFDINWVVDGLYCEDSDDSDTV